MIALLVWACGCDHEPPAAPTPRVAVEAGGADPALSLEATSERGRYQISARPAAPPVALHQMHDWIVRIELRAGSSELPTSIHFDGGMPSHGHGFVTRPRLTQNLGDGAFLVEGVKFHMPGAWVLRITVTSGAGRDHVELPLTIAP